MKIYIQLLLFLFLIISSFEGYARGTNRESLIPPVKDEYSTLQARKYSIEELVVFKDFANTTKARDFILGDNGEGGGTKDFGVEKEVNNFLEQLPESLDENGIAEIEISKNLAFSRASLISIFSIRSFYVHKYFLLPSQEEVEIENIKFFYLKDLEEGEEIFRLKHLAGFRTYDGRVYSVKVITGFKVLFASE